MTTLKENMNLLCCCLNMRKVSRAVTQYYDQHLEPTGLRITQLTLLVELANPNLRNLSEISEKLVMDRTTLTRNLQPLQKAGYLEIALQKDKRAKNYVLTEKGQEVLERAIPLWEEIQNKIISAFGTDEYNKLLAELEKMLRITSTQKKN